jgi:vacuolar-type H+-ATPase subunit F/Vma7
MPEILFLGEPKIIEGFALTGARIRPETDPTRAARLVEQHLRAREAGIIVVTESIFEQMPEKTRTQAEASGRPIFVTLPNPAGFERWEGAEDLISRIIRRAIGYRLKIKR